MSDPILYKANTNQMEGIKQSLTDLVWGLYMAQDAENMKKMLGTIASCSKVERNNLGNSITTSSGCERTLVAGIGLEENNEEVLKYLQKSIDVATQLKAKAFYWAGGNFIDPQVKQT